MHILIRAKSDQPIYVYTIRAWNDFPLHMDVCHSNHPQDVITIQIAHVSDSQCNTARIPRRRAYIMDAIRQLHRRSNANAAAPHAAARARAVFFLCVSLVSFLP